MTFIQEHACERIKVPEVAASVAISRSGLEKRFASVLGYTIRTAIKRAQLERTRRLVRETDLPLKQVAAETGFRSVQHMTTLYVQAFGVTPARHRRQSAPEVQLAALGDAPACATPGEEDLAARPWPAGRTQFDRAFAFRTAGHPMPRVGTSRTA
jgi:AraC-like DNA-binding protein